MLVERCSDGRKHTHSVVCLTTNRDLPENEPKHQNIRLYREVIQQLESILRPEIRKVLNDK